MADIEMGVTSYSDLATADEWFRLRHHKDWAATDAVTRAGALVRATEWLDGQFRFGGKPMQPDQIRAWPRDGFADAVTSTGLPAPVQQAYFLLALALLDGDDAGEAALGLGGRVVSERVGAVSVRYGAAHDGTRIDALLAPYLVSARPPLVVRS